MNLAWASAKEDSDWAKSAILTWPLSTLILSVSTCLSDKLTFLLFIENFSFAKIKPEKASTAFKRVVCSVCKSLASAKTKPILLFL